MALQNGTSPGAVNANHKRRQSSRVVPVIPRQLTRAATVKRSSESTVEKSGQEKSTQHGITVAAQSSEEAGKQEMVDSTAKSAPALPALEDSTSASKEVEGSPVTNGVHAEKAIEAALDSTEVNGGAEESSKIEQAELQTSREVDDSRDTATETPQTDAPRQAQSNGQRRTELPPPFVPSAQSVLHAGHKTESQPVTQAARAMNSQRPFIFGATSDTYSSNSSPTPPASAGSGISLSAHFPGVNGAAPPASQVLNGSDHGRTGSFPGPQAPSFTPYDSQQNFYPVPPQYLQWPQAPTHPNYPSQGSQPFAAPLPNGNSETPRSGSQVSLPTSEPQPHYRNQSTHGHNGSMQYSVPYQQNLPALHPGTRHSDYRGTRNSGALEHNIYALQSYLDDQLGQLEFADSLMHFEDNGKPLPCHAFMLARNHRLRSMLRSNTQAKIQYQDKAYDKLDVTQKYYFKSSLGFVEAVRYIYGGQTLNERALIIPFLSSPEALVTSVLSYAAAGCTLEIPDIVVAALTVVSYRLTWTSLEVALEFALDGGMSAMWRRYSITPVDGAKHEDAQTSPTYGPYASDVLEMVVRFICWNFNPDFTFDNTASQLSSIQRFPDAPDQKTSAVVHGPRSPVSDHRFRGIRLGSFQAQSTASSTLSSVLLSVPLPVVQSVFDDLQMQERINPMIIETYMRAVVDEREKRRQSSLQTFDKQNEVVNGDAPLSGMQKVLRTREEVPPSEQGMPRFKIVSHYESANGQ